MRIIKLPLPYYGPADDKGGDEPLVKSEAEKQRESIEVTNGKPKEKEEENKEDGNDEKKDDDDEVKEDDAEGDGDEEKEDEAKDEEQKELTAEQKEIAALTQKLERAQRRAGKTAAEREENRKKIKELTAALEANVKEGEQPLTEEEVTKRARELATIELNQREFDAAQDNLINDATKIDKTFMSKVKDMAEEVAPLPEFFIGALNDLDNGGAVLNYLTDNVDEYEELLKKKGAVRVMKGLVDISNKLIEAAKTKPKKISNAPEPPKVPKGNNKNPDALPTKPTENMAEFVRVRNAADKAKREANG